MHATETSETNANLGENGLRMLIGTVTGIDTLRGRCARLRYGSKTTGTQRSINLYGTMPGTNGVFAEVLFSKLRRRNMSSSRGYARKQTKACHTTQSDSSRRFPRQRRCGSRLRAWMQRYIMHSSIPTGEVLNVQAAACSVSPSSCYV